MASARFILPFCCSGRVQNARSQREKLRGLTMPELPEVEIFNRLVHDHCRGRTIEQAVVSDPGSLEGISAEALERRVRGRRIRASKRYGKHLFILLDGAGALVMHFGTNGSLQLAPRDKAVPSFTRIHLHFAGGEGLAYVNPRRLGRVSVCDDVQAFVAKSGLGPDALDPAFDVQAFASCFAGRRRDIKAVFMDQTLMAGIGNIYSDEILFSARIHPATAACDLEPDRVLRLFAAMRETLEAAIRCGAGSEKGLEQLPKNFLATQRHKGGRCPRCGAALAIARLGGRTSYHCPRCQPK